MRVLGSSVDGSRQKVPAASKPFTETYEKFQFKIHVGFINTQIGTLLVLKARWEKESADKDTNAMSNEF